MQSPTCTPWSQNISKVNLLICIPLTQRLSRAEVVRGAISNGYQWAFIILQLNENGKGGKYMITPEIEISFKNKFPNHVTNREPDIIAGILAHWVCRCFLCSVGFDHEHDTDAAPLQQP